MIGPLNALSAFSAATGYRPGNGQHFGTRRGKGIVVGSEPSVVAIDKRTRKPYAVGAEAKAMGANTCYIVAIRPLKDGVIADFDMVETMLKHFIRKGPFAGPDCAQAACGHLAIPSGVTEWSAGAAHARPSKRWRGSLPDRDLWLRLSGQDCLAEPIGSMTLT